MGNNKKRILLLSAVIVIAVCLTLAVAPTFARYFTNIVTDKAYWFTYENGNAVYVYGEHITDENSEWKKFDNSAFVQDAESATITFSIANGTARDSFAKRTQEVSLCLVVGATAGTADNIAVNLSFGEKTLTGKYEEIKEDSYLYSTSGPGWVYRFYDDGSEAVFTLEGGKFDFENLTVTVSGTVEPTLLDLRITGAYVQANT